MRFKEFLEEAGKVHLIKKDNPPKKRGAPEEPARAFDKKPKDRSVLKKLADKSNKFHVIQGEIEFYDKSDPANDEIMQFGNTVQVHVMGGNATEQDITSGRYSGINVVFPLKDTKLELDPKKQAYLVSGDGIARKQEVNYEHSIVKAALDAIKKNDIPGIYSGLGGREYNIKKIGGAAEWEQAQLSKLKDKGWDKE